MKRTDVFRIAGTFHDSPTKLSGQEQKAVKPDAFDLQLNPAQPGLQLHHIEGAKDPNYWSVSVRSDIRLAIHKTKTSFLLCYFDHHDDANDWPVEHKIEHNPTYYELSEGIAGIEYLMATIAYKLYGLTEEEIALL